MLSDCRSVRPVASWALALLVLSAWVTPGYAQNADLTRRIQSLEQRVRELEAEKASNAATANGRTANISPEALQALLDRVNTLESRLGDLETSAVLSEPETRVKRVEVYVDKNGNEYDQPTPGAKKTVTYQRERVLRRQTINEKIEEALSDEAARRVAIGVDAATVTQFANQSSGPDADADGHAYQFAAADLTFAANLAQNTSFFADIVGVSGSPPDKEIPTLTLLNSYTARLQNKNELNLREAWLRSEFFEQRLAVSLGRLDLTNYFDKNAAANDETTQFISDALVNNPALGLTSNGSGVVAVYDAKNGINFKLGAQQSDPDATNLSESIFSLAEVGYLARPFSLPEGNYRAWFRRDNSSGRERDAYGVSLDQKLNPNITLFARYGSAESDTRRDRFYSGGFEFEYGLVLNPLDAWGIGYSYLDLGSGDSEHLQEAYYNFHLAERLRLSLHLQHVTEARVGGERFGYLLPGLRLQAAF
jgi:carbohydrate-selective porin (OprB family)